MNKINEKQDEQGAIIHAVAKIGDAMINLFDSKENWAPTPTFLNLYVSDVEQAYNNAIAFGAKSVTDITTLWFGEKVCRILDPFGNLWWLNERVKEVDFTNMETVQHRATTPEAIAGIAYIQSSLNDAMLAQKDFFERK
ncbi:VOC family protein [Sphingobacterium corticis]|uniref:VOC family protein n=1 Tax=Sphingobacterium corticis TaxID=1812823 RepID=A0ABW5NKE8_9SPHI